MNTTLLIALRLCLPALAGQAPAEASRFEPAIVKLERIEGRELWTVRARESSVSALLNRVCELSGRSVDGTSAMARAPLVTISLERRPLEQVLEFALGSAGLLVEVDDESIRVRADLAARETPEQRAGLASAAWGRAAAQHPHHPVAATARLAQGELEQLSGRDDAARQRYLDLLAQAPTSSAAGEAYLRTGRLAAERGDWSEASEHFRALANLAGADEYRAVARVELARATLRLGDAEGALHILDALDLSHPCWERTELSARALVRIEALLAGQRFQDALLEIEARSADFDPLGAKELPRLRARALEGAGLPEEASRAWLLVARGEAGPLRVSAYQSAARLAELAGDPLDVLFVAREAQAAGFGPCVAEAERRARARLGVEARQSDATPRAELRLLQAERWLEKRDLQRASDEFELLFDAREDLDLTPLARARLALGWLRCLAAQRDVETAVALAHSEREGLEAGEPRAFLDRGLAALLEEHGLFERAADAYQGEY